MRSIFKQLIDLLHLAAKSRFGSKSAPPIVRETSRVASILAIYPNAEAFLNARYAIRIADRDRKRSLGAFVREHGLPPAQILFMEIQLDAREKKVRSISAKEAKTLLDEGSVRVFDVRESWERKHGTLPGAVALDKRALDELMSEVDREHPLLFYCHFGVRSMDAASYFADQGFQKVLCLTGGIDAWAQEVDTSLPRYYEAPC